MREVEAGKGGREGGGASRCYLDPRPSSPPTLLRLPSVSLETDTSQHPTDQSSHARPGRWDRRGFHLWPRLLENQRKEKEREGGTDGKAMCGICDHPWTPRASNGSWKGKPANMCLCELCVCVDVGVDVCVWNCQVLIVNKHVCSQRWSSSRASPSAVLIALQKHWQCRPRRSVQRAGSW